MNQETAKLLKYVVQALFVFGTFALIIFNLEAFLTLIAAIVGIGGSLILGAIIIVLVIFLLLLIMS